MELVPTCKYCGKPFAGEHKALTFFDFPAFVCPNVPNDGTVYYGYYQ